MNNSKIYTGLIAGAVLSGCATYKIEYSSRMIIPGEVTWKSKNRNNKDHNIEVKIDLGENVAILNRNDENLYKKVNINDTIKIVCREVYDSKYKNDKLIDKSLIKLNIYHICKTGNCKKDSLYVPRRFIQK